MFTATHSFRQSCWQRFGNIPSVLTGLTTGGVVAFIVCCAGPAAVGAAIGGGTAVGTGATVGIIATSTFGGCVIGMGINRCIKWCGSQIKDYFALEHTESTKESAPATNCCSSTYTSRLTALSSAQAFTDDSDEPAQAEHGSHAYHPSFSGKQQKMKPLLAKVSSCKEAIRDRSVRQNKLS